MADFFASHIQEEYQRKSICGELKLASWPTEKAQLARLLERWLVGETKSPANVEPLLRSFTAPPVTGMVEAHAPILSDGKSYYYGSEGKREAVLQFFSLILKEKSPQTLFLCSEEEMGWLYEDPVFAAQWAAAFTSVLQAGNRVKIVHNIGRDLNELLEAVSKWVPIYSTGMIEPYYYPKLRDGVCQRTVFLAPKTAAVTSSSVLRQTDGMLNQLITDKRAVSALALEYERYFSLCRPLMRIITVQQADELWNSWEALARSDADTVCMVGAPTLATMPQWVAEATKPCSPVYRKVIFFRCGSFSTAHSCVSWKAGVTQNCWWKIRPRPLRFFCPAPI